MTMWVADPSDNKIYAYRMSDKSRDPDKDFDILSDNHNPRADLFIGADNTPEWLDNTNPHGIWSDGATMWVTNTLIASTNRNLRLQDERLEPRRRQGPDTADP